MLSIILATVGVGVFIYGFLITFGFIKTDVSKDSDMDKRLMSEKSRYFIGRYNSGIQFMMAGAAAAFLGAILYFS